MKNIDIIKSLPVLYVEDDDILMASTKKTLSIFFDDITTATNGLDAIKLINSKKFNIAILDIRIPHLSGLEIAKEIRKTDKEMLIFITSNYQETDDLRQALKLDMVDYLVKPFSFDELMGVLNDCADRIKERGLLIQQISNNVFYYAQMRCVIKDGIENKLTKNEVDILELFLKEKGSVVKFEEIEYSIFSDSNDSKYGAIKNLISRLRKKIGEDSIVNIYEVGYYIK